LRARHCQRDADARDVTRACSAPAAVVVAASTEQQDHDDDDQQQCEHALVMPGPFSPNRVKKDRLAKRRAGVRLHANAGAPRAARSQPPRGRTVDANTDDLKGRAKEAVGDLTDNQDLKNEGKTDRASGKLKQAVDKVEGKAKDLIDDVKDKVQHKD
jgi:uncharacterized protein YjbJ (UPF0337 family)